MFRNSQDEEEGRVVGYDRYTSIAEETEKACKIHTRPGGTCTSPELVMLPHTSKECMGEIYVITEGGTTRVA